MTTKNLIDTYNVLATRLGQKTIKTFQGKKSDLEAKIAELEAQVKKSKARKASAPDDEAERAAAEAELDLTPQERKRAKKAKKSTNAPEPKDDGLLSLADIARELGINPKVARAKLRRTKIEATAGLRQETRYMRVARGSDEYHLYLEVLAPKKEEQA